MGKSIMSADVSTLEEGFQREHLELTAAEVNETSVPDWSKLALDEVDDEDDA